MKRKLVLRVLGAVVLLGAAAVAGLFYVRNLVSMQRQRAIGGMLVDREMLLMHWRNLEPDKSLEKEQPKNEFDRRMLDWFAKRKPEEIAKLDGPEYPEGPVTEHKEYQYFQAIRAEQNCTRTCHTPNASALPTSPETSPIGRASPDGQKWKEGDLMAVAVVTIRP